MNAYSQLEFSMNDAIAELANVERRAGVCMTAQMIGPGLRIRCLLALLELRKAPQVTLDEFNRIGSKIEGLARQRNRFVHDPIVLDRESGKIARMQATADRKMAYGFVETEIKDLLDLCIKLDRADHEFNLLYLQARDALPQWPRTQFAGSEGIEVHRYRNGGPSDLPPNDDTNA